MSYVINEEGAVVLLLKGWVQGSEALYSKMEKELAWSQPLITVWGKKRPTPRLQSAAGDAGARAYTYSGSNIPLVNWTANSNESVTLLRQIRDAAVSDTNISTLTQGCNFNSCLVNYYRNGADVVGWHADKEQTDPMQSVVTISLGCARKFKLRRKDDNKRVITVLLESGDLILMCGKTQELWEHSIPKVSTNKCSTGRISLTYRLI